MPVAAYPDAVVQLFDAAKAPLELLDRVDQAWDAMVTGAPEPAAAHHYVRAVEAVSGAMLDGARSRSTSALPDGPTVVTAASLAPITEIGVAAASAVLISVLGAVTLTALLPGLDAAIGLLRSRRANNVQDATMLSAPSLAQTISDVLADTFELPLKTIRRVFRPTSDQELGRWLGVSRTTVGDWSLQRFAPSAARERRLETVAGIARLIDRYVHPEDVQLYLRTTPLPAFDGKTLDTVLCTPGEDGLPALQRALEMLRAALVQ